MSIFTQATLLHNPRCTKSRQALAYLNENNIEVDVIEYLKVPLNKKQIESIFLALQLNHPIEMVRTKEKEFNEAGLTKSSSAEAVFDAITSYPKLLERPILITSNGAAIGRPLENIIALLSK